MSYAVRNDGKGWRAVSGPSDVGPDEQFATEQPGPMQPTQSDLAKTEIAKLLAGAGLSQKWQVQSAMASALALILVQGGTEEQAYADHPGYREAKDLLMAIELEETKL